MTPALLGFFRGLGTSVIFAALAYLSVASNISLVVGVPVAGIIASIALAIEHAYSTPTTSAVFGAIKR